MKRTALFGLLLSSSLLAACSTAPKSVVTNLPATTIHRSTANAGLFWFAHPCREVKGAPFRKYHSFALDEYKGTIFARGNENDAAGKALQDKPKGKVAYGSVSEFLADKGITDFCAKNGGGDIGQPTNPDRPQNPGRPDKPPRGGGSGEDRAGEGDYRPTEKVNPPVNFDVALYYQPLHSTLAGDRQARVLPHLHQFLSRPHLQKVGAPDRVVSACASAPEDGSVCVSQRLFSYEGARKVMMGDVALGDLRQAADGSWELFDYYCQAWMGPKEFSTVANSGFPGPGEIVNARLMNTEHTWPQSKFPDGKGSRMGLMQKTDLHHIFPTDTKVNAERGNYEFAEVDRGTAKAMKCADALLGQPVMIEGTTGIADSKYFQPPRAHMGNVARALFYFSARYNAGMSSLQEAYLRRWHREDPADPREIARNEAIYKNIGVRNPFIDDASLADQVDRFCRAKLSDAQAPTANDCP